MKRDLLVAIAGALFGIMVGVALGVAFSLLIEHQVEICEADPRLCTD